MSEHPKPGKYFTPLLMPDHVRLLLPVSVMRGLTWKKTATHVCGIVTDPKTKKRYTIYPRPCGLPCYCDATAKEAQ